MRALLILLSALPFTAEAATYRCPVAANAGVKEVSFSFSKEAKNAEITYTFNSGYVSPPHLCRLDRIESAAGESYTSFLCVGPVRLKKTLLTTVLLVNEVVSIRFYDNDSLRLSDYGPGGPTEPCRKE